MSKHWIAEIPRNFVNFASSGQEATGNMCHEYAEKSYLNNFWTYPLHGIMCVLTMAATPLIMAISLIAALILVPAPLCGIGEFSCDWYIDNVLSNLGVSLFSIFTPLILLYTFVCPDDTRKHNRGSAPQNGSNVVIFEG